MTVSYLAFVWTSLFLYSFVFFLVLLVFSCLTVFSLAIVWTVYLGFSWFAFVVVIVLPVVSLLTNCSSSLTLFTAFSTYQTVHMGIVEAWSG